MQPEDKLIKAIEAYRMGQQEAFFQICKYSDKYLYTCINHVVHNPDVVPDFMQETYVEVSRNLNQLEDVDCYYGWIGTIATRKCYAYLRKTNKEILLGEEDHTMEETPDNEAFIPESIVQNKEKQRLLKDIIDKQLNDMQRLCIIGYYYNDQRQEDIAQELGIPLNTVKTNLSRAKAKIKKGVLSLEKEQNTRLYSIAPALVLLLDQEVRDTFIPDAVISGIAQTITGELHHQAVMHSVKAATTVTAKTVTRKAVGHAIKGKIAAAVIGVALVGGVGTVVVKHHTQVSKPVQQVTVKKQSVDQKSNKSKKQNTKKVMTTKEIQLSKTDQDNLKVLLGAYFCATTVYGTQSQKEITQLDDNTTYQFDLKNNESLIKYMSVIGELTVYPKYKKYVPSLKEKKDGTSYIKMSDTNSYLKEIFNSDISKMSQSDDKDDYIRNTDEFPIYYAQVTRELCPSTIEKVLKNSDGTITLQGRETDYNDEDLDKYYADTFQYTAVMKKNKNSIYGYQLVSLTKKKTEHQLKKKVEEWKIAYNKLEYPDSFEGEYSSAEYDFDQDEIPEFILEYKDMEAETVSNYMIYKYIDGKAECIKKIDGDGSQMLGYNATDHQFMVFSGGSQRQGYTCYKLNEDHFDETGNANYDSYEAKAFQYIGDMDEKTIDDSIYEKYKKNFKELKFSPIQ